MRDMETYCKTSQDPVSLRDVVTRQPDRVTPYAGDTGSPTMQFLIGSSVFLSVRLCVSGR